MSIGRFSDYQVQQWLDAAAEGGFYVACHYDNPDVAGAYASEVFGGTYQRSLAPFSTVDGRTMWNTSPIKWTGLPSVVITHLAGWDAQVNGNLQWYSSLDSIVRVVAGGTWSIGSQTIALSIN